jgi:hypothetical protein
LVKAAAVHEHQGREAVVGTLGPLTQIAGCGSLHFAVVWKTRGSRRMISVMNSSVLELAVGGLPFPHGGPDGEWRYRHAIRPEGATALDHQAVADFRAYERAHGRDVAVVADPSLSDWTAWQRPTVRPRPDAFAIQCCTDVYRDGCSAPIVCHGTPGAAAARIMRDGILRCATAMTGRNPDVLAAASTWGEPPDYFEHVMLAHGRCTAPEAVATSRLVGRDLVPSDLTAGYRPTVRFYFAWDALASQPNATFDGVHPVKVHGQLSLDELLVAVVVHASERDTIGAAMSSRHRDRIVLLDIPDPRPDEWAAAATETAERMM